MASILEEKDAIRDVMSAYCFYVDNREFEKFTNLFTADAICNFITAAVPREGEGPARKHCTVNHLIRVNGAEARADSYIIVLRESDSGGSIMASLAGRYEDLLVKEGNEWRFKVRKIHFDITGDLGLKK